VCLVDLVLSTLGYPREDRIIPTLSMRLSPSHRSI
jgi:hypothetical protein